jgi:hypothetical protein
MMQAATGGSLFAEDSMTRRVTTLLLGIVLLAGVAEAAPFTMTLVRTTALYNDDPTGSALARTQHDSGDVLYKGEKIGEYVRVKNVNAAGLNVAAVKIALFIPGRGDLPNVITLEGVHSFNTGNEAGSVSASDLGIVGTQFRFEASTDELSLLFP